MSDGTYKLPYKWVCLRNFVIESASPRPGGKRGAGVPGYGDWGVENAGSGREHGVWWKTRGLVENTGSGGKHGVSVENTGSGGKHGVWWKTRGLMENTGSQWKTLVT